MAKSMVYAVYDSKVKFFHFPMFMRNRGEALRSWAEAANDGKTQISSHPEDFALMELGEFDDQTGKIEMLSVPESLGLAIQFKNKETTPSPLFENNVSEMKG